MLNHLSDRLIVSAQNRVVSNERDVFSASKSGTLPNQPFSSIYGPYNQYMDSSDCIICDYFPFLLISKNA